MQTLVDRTRDALHVEVCSVYLLDHATAADAGRHERPRPGAHRPGQPRHRRRRHRCRAAARRPIEVPDVASGPALQVPPRLRPRRAHLDAVGAADVERRRHRGAQRPDRRDAGASPRARSTSWSRSRRSSPGSSRRGASSASRSASSRAPAARRGAGRAPLRRHARAADPAGGGAAYIDLLADVAWDRGTPRRAPSRRMAQRRTSTRSRASTGSSTHPRLGPRRGPRRRWPACRSTSAAPSPRRSSSLRPLLRYHPLRWSSPNQGARRRWATRRASAR